jgi:hypothetical protein
MTLGFHLSHIGRRTRIVGGVTEYLDDLPPPTQDELDATRADAQAAWDLQQAPDTRKVWPNAHAFWESFTPPEQLAILSSEVDQIRLLDRALVLWQGELWSDDPRVQQGLDALVAIGILTESRRDEILALTPS